MPANLDPIYSKAGDIQSSALIATAATVVYNGSGTIATDVYKIWGADATNGGFLQRVRIKYVANATTASNACVMKFYLSAATSGAVTDATMFFYDEIAIPATGTLTTTAGNVSYDLPCGLALPAGWSIFAKITVAQPASCGFIATGIGGKY